MQTRALLKLINRRYKNYSPDPARCDKLLQRHFKKLSVSSFGVRFGMLSGWYDV